MSQAPLPPTSPPDVVNVDNVQGDVILGFPKKKEEFVFFVVTNPERFKAAVPHLKIASTGDVQRSLQKIQEVKKQDPGSLVPLPLLNIAFSQKGLHALNINDDLLDVPFSQGQFAGAKDLGDDGVVTSNGFEPHWEHAFTGRIDGVLLAAGECWKTVDDTIQGACRTLGNSMRVVYKLKGSVRPGEQKGHEHFGWEDGISNPAVKTVVDKPLPGQRVIPPGTILVGKDKDPVPGRPAWATEGSFLVFRQLSQLVPEFHDFLDQNPIPLPGLDRKQGSELLGARLVGRWKSGAPIQLSPLQDDPELAKDPQRNNNFVFPKETGDEGQSACPYAAHIRKTNPRNDLDFVPGDQVAGLSITRSGIPYGPEVTPGEEDEKKTEHERGLAFVCYQSSLQIGPVSKIETDRGFKFIQRFWANNPDFPFQKQVQPGFDPIIGQANGASRTTLGTSSGPTLTMPRDFVVSRGGEYFFSPSIHALKTVFSGVAA